GWTRLFATGPFVIAAGVAPVIGATNDSTWPAAVVTGEPGRGDTKVSGPAETGTIGRDSAGVGRKACGKRGRPAGGVGTGPGDEGGFVVGARGWCCSRCRSGRIVRGGHLRSIHERRGADLSHSRNCTRRLARRSHEFRRFGVQERVGRAVAAGPRFSQGVGVG